MKRVLLIRLISEYRSKVRGFIYDIAQFQSLLSFPLHGLSDSCSV